MQLRDILIISMRLFARHFRVAVELNKGNS